MFVIDARCEGVARVCGGSIRFPARVYLFIPVTRFQNARRYFKEYDYDTAMHRWQVAVCCAASEPSRLRAADFIGTRGNACKYADSYLATRVPTLNATSGVS